MIDFGRQANGNGYLKTEGGKGRTQKEKKKKNQKPKASLRGEYHKKSGLHDKTLSNRVTKQR
jgi:hypothetical protein